MHWKENAAATLPDTQLEMAWSAWFSTPGDTDDILFYWEEAHCSEK